MIRTLYGFALGVPALLHAGGVFHVHDMVFGVLIGLSAAALYVAFLRWWGGGGRRSRRT